MEKLSRNVLASKCHFGYIVSNDRLKKVDKVVLDCAYFCFFSKHPGHQGQKSAVPLTIINSTRKFQPPPEQGQRKYTQQSALQIYPHSPSFLAKKHHVKTTGHSDYLCKKPGWSFTILTSCEEMLWPLFDSETFFFNQQVIVNL